jgi:hypothetical protein
MNRGTKTPERGAAAGIRIREGTTPGHDDRARLRERLDALGLRAHVEKSSSDGHVRAALTAGRTAQWTPGADTLGLAGRLGLDTSGDDDLEREIVAALLAAPVPIDFPGYDEFESAVRIRRHTVQAARRTALAFDTHAIERPEDCWTYDPATGFTVRPGRGLIEALRRATQPELTGRLYAFSCYRASEYVMLLGIAQEVAECHPALFARLQAQAERRAIQSGEFHEVFLREHGSMDAPMPGRWYVPGDRVWFRNPDERSADAHGYEGSWVVYLGDGLFSNFWQRDRPFTLTRKAVEIYHWRHATWADDAGALRIDEDEVERRVAASLADPSDTESILAAMLRPREPRGVYRDGGCLDTTRECARWVRPGTCDLALPAH